LTCRCPGCGQASVVRYLVIYRRACPACDLAFEPLSITMWPAFLGLALVNYIATTIFNLIIPFDSIQVEDWDLIAGGLALFVCTVSLPFLYATTLAWRHRRTLKQAPQ
jgi:uncharacterized protein (DUF983 family)